MNQTIISDIEREQLAIKELQEKLLQHGINSSCPYCHSSQISNYGKNGNMQRFKCKDCGKTFSLFTGTILEKCKHSWKVWVEMTYMILNKNPMRKMLNTLHDDFGLLSLDQKSVFVWKHKIINAMAKMPHPKLKGVIQVDETFFREGQKGSKHLISTVEGIERTARYGPAPSKYGVTGNEFANVVAAIDNRGYCVAKVVCLGNLTIDLFYELFDEHFEDITVLCTDGNYVYRRYSDLKKVMHYILPSNHLEIKKQNGYAFNWASAEEKKDNETILRRLYHDKLIEHMNKGAYLAFSSSTAFLIFIALITKTANPIGQ